jgi:hypothetical protein
MTWAIFVISDFPGRASTTARNHPPFSAAALPSWVRGGPTNRASVVGRGSHRPIAAAARAGGGADSIARNCIYADNPISGFAFTTERDLDAQGSQERLRPASAASERAEILVFGIRAISI